MELTQQDRDWLASGQVKEMLKKQPIEEVLPQVFLAGKREAFGFFGMVTITRKWHSPAINVNYTNEGIRISMNLDDFLRCLSATAPHPLRAPLRRMREDQLLQARLVVEDEMKMATLTRPPPIDT